MTSKQKETILALLKANEISRNYKTNYWFSYEDFLNPTDDFTAFSCEQLDGKQGYINLIKNLLGEDGNAQIFVEVYGYEEDHKEQFIYADTLIIFSKLSLSEVKRIFNEPKDIFPSDIGELTDFSRQAYVIDNNGEQSPVIYPSGDGCSVFYCWWD